MNVFHGLVTVSFVILALLHVPHPKPLLWLPYAGGAVIAGLTLLPKLSIPAARLLAVAATALMFFFFAGFFTGVPRLEADWYQSQEGWSTVALLLGGFTLIPVLSVYSCRCKAECRGGERRGVLGRHGFFTAPDQTRSS
jgi:hypothetical protein